MPKYKFIQWKAFYKNTPSALPCKIEIILFKLINLKISKGLKAKTGGSILN
jgi:hypothetical protein